MDSLQETTAKDLGGRPKVITDAVLGRLKRAFRWGWSVSSACRFAEVPRQTYYDFENRNGFRTERKLLQSWPEQMARRNVVQALEEGNVEVSRWFLERRSPDYLPGAKILVGGDRDMDEAALVAALEKLIQERRRTSSVTGPPVIDHRQDALPVAASSW